ncbi:MAG: alpha/beta fold hydrolase, partial [Myxococcales bacterium]
GAKLDAEVAKRFFFYAVPGLGTWFLARNARRLGAEGVVRQILTTCCVDINRIPAEVYAAHVALFDRRLREHPHTHHSFIGAARSVLRILAGRRRFYAEVDRIRAPTLIVHGAQDRLVHVASSRALVDRRPDFRLAEFEDVGHVPQLEDPERFVDTVAPWLDGLALDRQDAPATSI